jgi:SAM-dependent methyltransferase
LEASTTWLDFGSGNGGLVRYCQKQNLCRVVGFEEGAIRDDAARHGIPFLNRDELERRVGTFDVVTAIEVLEHIENPLEALRQIRSLLRPGGVFFLTTGNAEPYRASLLDWQYVIPEIHISFYEPETLRQALLCTGFRPEFRGYLPGFTDIIRFKILKNLRIRHRATWQDLLPWPLLARLADARYRVSSHPIAWAV